MSVRVDCVLLEAGRKGCAEEGEDENNFAASLSVCASGASEEPLQLSRISDLFRHPQPGKVHRWSEACLN